MNRSFFTNTNYSLPKMKCFMNNIRFTLVISVHTGHKFQNLRILKMENDNKVNFGITRVGNYKPIKSQHIFPVSLTQWHKMNLF